MMQALRTWQRANPVLTGAIWFHVALTVSALVALPFDHRHILGLDPWIKPLKFDLSTLIFLFTMAVLLRLLEPFYARPRALVAILVSAAMVVENSLISLQSLRGVRSHMNYSTAFDATAFSLMGFFIVVNTVAVALLLLLWCRAQPAVPRTIALGARLGLLALLAGSLEGVKMVVNNGHTVGARDGGPGLPFVNWSTQHGDFRVAHFFALHCLQAMLLLGWGLSRTRWRVGVQMAALSVAYLGYLGGLWWLFQQALAGRPLLG